MNLIRRFCRTAYPVDLLFKNPHIFKVNYAIFKEVNLDICRKDFSLKYYSTSLESNKLIQQPVNLPKKRIVKKKKQLFFTAEEGFRITAFSTAEEYNLENLLYGLSKLNLYEPSSFGSDFGNSVDVIHAKQHSENQLVQQDLFFFRDGCVVMWNIPDSEMIKILDFLRPYEDNRYIDDIIKNESEIMTYSISNSIFEFDIADRLRSLPKGESEIHPIRDRTKIVNDCLVLAGDSDVLLEKYAVSNAMALSVHLGTYEANLEQYIETMEPITDDLKTGNKIKMSRSEVLQKTGQLFALRHNINLNSDLLDTPDFYWDRGQLEILYHSIINYYCINKRTRVMNEKINHCIELVELLSSHLNDKHHVRLEWMIIILIMIEVAFEFSHYLEKYLEA